MGLFGITLKKIESIPVIGDVVNAGVGLEHDLFGGGGQTGWLNGSNGTSSPSGGGGSSWTPPQGSGGYMPQGGGQYPRPPMFRPPQQQPQAPNPMFLRPPQIQQPQNGFTPRGYHRDQNGNLVPDTQMPQVNNPTGPDPVGDWLKQKFAVPVVNLAHQVGSSVAGQGVRLATAELTHNNQAISDAKAGMGQAVRDLAPPAPYLDDQGNPTNKVPQGVDQRQWAKKHANPAAEQYIETMASGGEGEGMGALSVSARTARASAKAAKVAEDVKGAPKPTPKTFTAPEGSTAPKTSVAFQKLNDLYDHNNISAESTNNLVNKSIGISRQFSDAGNQLEKAMSQELTPTERIAVRDVLEGETPQLGPKDNPAKVQEVAAQAKQLSDKGYDVLDNSSKTNMHRVQQYATRLAKFSGTKPTTNVVARGISDVKSLFNIHSGFSRARAIGKFTGENGDVKYGTKSDLGLKPNKNGDLVDSQGVVYKPQAVSTKELKANGFNYEDDYGKIANTYHSSVGRVKVAQAAKDELLANPEKYGLVKGEDGAPPKGYEPIWQVPELNGYFAPGKDAKAIDTALGHPKSTNLIERGWQGLNNGVIQSIVYNPLLHTRNLNELAGLAAGKAKNSAFGGAYIKKAYLDLAQMGDVERSALNDRMNTAGVVRETYGTDHSTVLSNALDKAHIPHVNKASSAAMAHIDWNVRSALFHLATTGKNALSDEQAAALVNHFLGDRASAGPVARNVGLFWHYFKTRTGIVTDAAKHPIANRGTIGTAAVQAAVLFAATKAFQEWTGNKHASLGHPGVFGLETDASNIIHARPNAVAASKMNPLVIAGLNQLYGKDLYTGKDFASGSDRLHNAEQTLFAPVQTADKVEGGKQTPAQAALQVATGISLPHTKGSPAIPNQNNPLAASFNAKGSKPAADWGADHDPTGIDQANLYYKAKDAGLKAVSGNPEATDLFNAYLDDEAAPGGGKMKKSPAETMGVAEALSGSPAALSAMQKFETANPQHDPMWDLSQQDLKTFLKTQGSSSSSGVKAAHEIIDTGFNNGEGLSAFIKRRDAYYGNSGFAGSSTAADNPETPKYPNFQGQQLLDYNLYKAQFGNNADPKEKSAWLASHPDVVEAIASLNNYYNDLNFAQTGLRTKDSVNLTPEQQAAYNEYNSLPKGNGKYGGSPDRAAWIKAHQDMWNSITEAFGQSDLVGLAKQGAVNQYQGVNWTPQFLKDAYNAGHYDIAPTKQADGSTSYAFNPPAASEANYAASSKGFTPYAKGGRASLKQEAAYLRLKNNYAQYRDQVHAAAQERDAEHASKADSALIKGVARNAKLRGPKRMSVHMRGQEEVKPYKTKGATLQARHINRVAPKAQKQLSRSNHAKLKT